MQPSAGSRFGPYEILALLGEGGMGAVYRATDLRLNRDVALKILPGTGSESDDQLLLLEEARAAGALAHPNVVTLYDFGLEGATPYLVAELIDGRRLRAEIDRGIVPLKRLLDLAAQIAAGLSAAHARGIAHLDLKPENVMVTPDGRAKIVDFGLAQFFNERVRRPNATMGESQSETLPMAGTAAYMSPEQARGDAGDFRSDQFSFGLILYELATGIHPLRCATASETLAAIVETEPRPIAERNPNVPAPLRWIVERCLAKEPAERYASTADLARDLAGLRDRLGEVASIGAAGPTAVASSRRLVVYGTAATLTVIVAAGAFIILGAPPPVPPVPIPVVTYTSYQGAPAWSPDGKTLAYVAQVGGVLQIFTRTLSSPSPEEVTTRPFDCTDPFWSQDGSRIYFHSLAEESDSLWSVPATGGTPVLVIKNASRAALSPDGQTLVFSRLSDGWPMTQSLWVGATSGGDAHRFSRGPFADAVINGSWFRFSPDGSKLLAWTYLTPEAGASRSRFWIVPWPDGEPYEVLQSLGGRGLAGVTFDWMPDNQRIVIAVADQHSSSTSTHLWIADVLNDRLEPLTTTLGMENYPAVTRDGSRVAFTSEAVDFNLIEIPLNGLPPREILATSRSEMDPAWSARNSQYAFVSDRTGTLEIILSTPDRAFERSLLNSRHFSDDPTRAIGSLAFSPDGLRLAYQRLGDTSGYQVWISSVSGAGPATALAPGFGYQDAPSWSPDGSELALTVAPHGKWALATAKIGAATAPRVILEDVVPYSRPAWSPDGRWILCEGVDGLMLVSPDGRQTRTISDEPWLATAWNSDGTLVYGLREAATPRHFMLVAVDPATTSERVINPDLGVIPPANQPIRGLSRISTGGLLTSIARARSDIWMFDGFSRPEGLAARIQRIVAGKRR